MKALHSLSTLALLVSVGASTHGQSEAPPYAIGFIDTGSLQHGFVNNGDLAGGWRFRYALPGGRYRDYHYFDSLRFWVCAVDDTGGVRVSGLPFIWDERSDWGPPPDAVGKDFSGHVFGDALGLEADTLASFPLLAHSAIEKTWPVGVYGFRHWPGPYRKATTRGFETQYEMLADQQVYFRLVDTPYAEIPALKERTSWGPSLVSPPGHPIGVEIHTDVFGFEDSYAQDFLVYRLRLVRAQAATDSLGRVWLGLNVYLATPAYPGGWWRRRYYFERVPTGDGKEFALAYSVSAENWRARYGARPPLEHAPAVPGLAVLDARVSPGSAQARTIGVCSWHAVDFWNYMFDLWDDPESAAKVERAQYGLLSGYTTGLGDVELSNLFHPSALDTSFRFDEPQVVNSLRWYDAAHVLGVGPFSWAPTDTVVVVFALAVGDSVADLLRNVHVAHWMTVENNFHGSQPPDPPNVSVVPGDRRVRLYWDRVAEGSVDPLFGYRDFEGYRIYRTSVPPEENQWGTPMVDQDGNQVGWVPLAQFDLVDGIEGTDPMYPHYQLGHETGLVHTWVDTTVTNGVRYWYAVCAYDRGVPADPRWNPDRWPTFHSLENDRGTDPRTTPNLVEVVPGVVPSNYENSLARVVPLVGTVGNGPILPELLDPFAVTGHTYEISFEDTLTGRMRYWVCDLDEGRYVLRGAEEVFGEEPVQFDGLRLWVYGYTDVRIVQDSTGWFRADGGRSDCTWKVTGNRGPTINLGNDYEFRFTAEGDTSLLSRKFAPFEVWNLTRAEKVGFEIFRDSPSDSTAEMKSRWTAGDEVWVRERVEGRDLWTWRFVMEPDPQVAENRAPGPGDVLRVRTSNPFRTGDRFELRTRRYRTEPVSKEDLAQIKVVPNPYVVRAAWQLGEEHRVSFTRLPSECTIRVFTLAGEKVWEAEHRSETEGVEFWDLRTPDGMEAAPGLYILVVETRDGKKRLSKFAVIR